MGKIIITFLLFVNATLSLGASPDIYCGDFKIKDITGSYTHPNGQKTKDIAGNLAHPNGERVFDILGKLNPLTSPQFAIRINYSEGKIKNIKYQYLPGRGRFVYTVSLDGVVDVESCEPNNWRNF